MTKKLFGTDGARGVANQFPMTAEFAVKLGIAAGLEVCNVYNKVAIGRDTRVSGEMLEFALAAGFMSAGVDVILLGVLPTPALTTITPELDVDMSVMITASHNPYKDNGIKLITSQGNKFSDDVTFGLEELIEKNEFDLSPEKIGTVSKHKEAIVLYLEKAKSMIDEPRPLKGLRVVIDCSNGAFSNILPQVFKDLGAGVIAIGDKPDGYNINRDCGSQHPEQMLDTVVKSKAHIGIAVDGDGDRIIICDETGKKIASEQVIAYLAKTLKDEDKYNGNAVVSTVLSNTALERYIKSLGLDYYSTKVGERAVIEKMQEVGGSIGGEESGHIVTLDYSRSGDALAVSLILCIGLLKSKKKMSEIFPLFDFDFFVFESVDVKDRDTVKKVAANESIKKAVDNAVKKMKGIGRVVLHPSGTEPKIRVWVAGADEKLVKEASAEIINAVKKFQ
jgi:phosphoglucosamine mutase